MRRWIAPTLVSCAAAAAAAAQLFLASASGAHAGRLAGVAVLLAAVAAVWIVWLRAGALLAAVERDRADCERRYSALFEACGDAACAYGLPDDGGPGLLVAVNEAACMSLGYPRSGLLAMTCDELYAPEVRRAVQQRTRALREAGSLVFESTWLTSDGHRLPVEVSLRRVDTADGRLCLAVARDLSAHQELAEVSRGRAHTDELTGLLSGRGFFAMVGEARQRARRLSAEVLVLHAELVGLKDVNDRLGHAAGDALVLAVADVLRPTFRDSDVVARLESDEFVALAVLGRSDRERVDWRAIVTRFDEALAAKRAELAGEFVFSLRYGHRVVRWEELDDIDGLLARTRAGTPLPGSWTATRRVETVTAGG
jgi:diguanylate cyclase (GGDEF)-like protein/PAS domain S-box-containing protein